MTCLSAPPLCYITRPKQTFPNLRASRRGVELTLGELTASGGDGVDHLRGVVEGYELDLELMTERAPVLQHGGGYLEYPDGGYTYYYSTSGPAPRLAAPIRWVSPLDLTLTPVLEDQELAAHHNTYWEGAALVEGTVTGRAYIELTRYCK